MTRPEQILAQSNSESSRMALLALRRAPKDQRHMFSRRLLVCAAVREARERKVRAALRERVLFCGTHSGGQDNAKHAR